MSKKNNQSVTNIEDAYKKKHAHSPQNAKSAHLKLKWTFLMTVFITMLLIAIYFISPYSKIEAVSVRGTNEVLDQEVIDASMIKSGDSLWKTYFDHSNVEDRVKNQYPQVKEMKLSINNLNNIELEISEYETVAYLYRDETYFKVLDNGEVLEEAYPNTVGNLPIFFNFKNETVLMQLLEEYKLLDSGIQSMLSEIEWIENDRNPLLVKAYMNDGNEVLASIPSFSERLNHYPQLVRAVNGENGLFDLEAGAYFLPFSSAEDQTYDEDNSVDLDSEMEE
ncbi:cell division protein FtsQ/DivIB [Marinilactibacillus kalidii]|uniref:cell division protein FtsQ/DivIB n=1 Tax=Marinilactibacillus kalidii TaxID=2820274 RepID=UPI001ABED560|nr:cell division protein FtsQ/DivIB [Marinilactibacillus kalidii]